jgi:hypothetical protein
MTNRLDKMFFELGYDKRIQEINACCSKLSKYVVERTLSESRMNLKESLDVVPPSAGVSRLTGIPYLLKFEETVAKDPKEYPPTRIYRFQIEYTDADELIRDPSLFREVFDAIIESTVKEIEQETGLQPCKTTAGTYISLCTPGRNDQIFLHVPDKNAYEIRAYSTICATTGSSHD